MTERIPRILDDFLKLRRDGRVIVIYGPRRVGKTSLVHHILKLQEGLTFPLEFPVNFGTGEKILQVTGDDIQIQHLLGSQDLTAILQWAEGYDAIFLDEAQRVPNVGLALKMLIDARPKLNIIATGSASFELAGQLGEPLTGRQTPLAMFPIALEELGKALNDFELRQQFDDFLIYGMYPEVRTSGTTREKQEILTELTSSYLFKDILELDKVKSSKTLTDLLTLIALQVGSEVSLNELARQLSISVNTVARYLDLFEKSYVLYELGSFSRNLRNEIAKGRKYYFYDTGIRNALLNDFNPLEKRDDRGGLWENFVIMERIKALSYARIPTRFYFWRTYKQKEIDLVEEREGGIHTFEFKASDKKAQRANFPTQFRETYPDASFEVISPATLLDSLHAISGTEN